jgi:hypothetical protein
VAGNHERRQAPSPRPTCLDGDEMAADADDGDAGDDSRTYMEP